MFSMICARSLRKAARGVPECGKGMRPAKQVVRCRFQAGKRSFKSCVLVLLTSFMLALPGMEFLAACLSSSNENFAFRSDVQSSRQ